MGSLLMCVRLNGNGHNMYFPNTFCSVFEFLSLSSSSFSPPSLFFSPCPRLVAPIVRADFMCNRHKPVRTTNETSKRKKNRLPKHHFHRQCVFRFLWALLPLSAAFMRFIVCSIDRGSFQTHFHHITYTAYHGTHKLHETMFGMCYMTAERRKNAVQRGLYKEKSSKMDTGDRASLHYTAYRISHTVQSILFLAPPR